MASIATGKGPHSLAFDDEHAFIGGGGSVAIVDAMSYARIADVPADQVDGLAVSTLGRAVYAIDGRAGVIRVIDPTFGDVSPLLG